MPGGESPGTGDWGEDGDGAWDEGEDGDEDRSLPCSRSRAPVADGGRILVSTHLFPRTPSPEGARPSTWGWIRGSHYLGRVGSSPWAAWGAQSRSGGTASPHSSPLQAGKTGSSQPCRSFPGSSGPGTGTPGPSRGNGWGSHLAGAAGAGLALGNEALAVLHLPALVVAVWRDRGPEGVLGARGDLGRLRRILGTPPRARTLTDGAAATLGVEGVGAHDGTFQRRAGHRAQLRETGETPEGRALGAPERPQSFSLQRSQKPAFKNRGAGAANPPGMPGPALTRQMQLRHGSSADGKVSLLEKILPM